MYITSYDVAAYLIREASFDTGKWVTSFKHIKHANIRRHFQVDISQDKNTRNVDVAYKEKPDPKLLVTRAA